MAFSPSPNLGLQIGESQGADDWDDDWNANFLKLDRVTQIRCKDYQNDPPGEQPDDGDRYMIADSPTGDWSEQEDGVIACWNDTDEVWEFVTPQIGWVVYFDAITALSVERVIFVLGAGFLVPTSLLMFFRSIGAPSSVPLVVDSADPTKQVKISAASITTGNARTLTAPDKDVTLMSSAGDMMTGALNMNGQQIQAAKQTKEHYALNDKTASSLSSETLNLANGNMARITLDTNITELAFSNWEAGSGEYQEITVLIKQIAASSYTVGYHSSVKWAGGVAPTITANPIADATDILKFRSIDAGTIILGEVVAQDIE
jgi:hypothetical protein